MAGKPVAEIQVDGLAKLRRNLRKLDPEGQRLLSKNLKVVVTQVTMGSIQRRIAEDLSRAKDATYVTKRSRKGGVSRKYTSVRSKRSTGRLARSVRVLSSTKGVYIRGGSARVPYYGWRDFGGTLRPVGGRHNTQVRPFIKRGRYIYPAIDETRPQILRAVRSAYEEAVERVMQ